MTMASPLAPVGLEIVAASWSDLNRLARDFCVKHVRIEVGPVWPVEGAQLGMDAELSESHGIPERGEHPLKPDQFRDVYLALNTVLESQKYPISTQWPSLDNVHQHGVTPTVGSASGAPA